MNELDIALSQVEQVKQEIKQALIGKEIDMTDVPFTEYPSKVEEIGKGVPKEIATGSAQHMSWCDLETMRTTLYCKDSNDRMSINGEQVPALSKFIKSVDFTEPSTHRYTTTYTFDKECLVDIEQLMEHSGVSSSKGFGEKISINASDTLVMVYDRNDRTNMFYNLKFYDVE